MLRSTGAIGCLILLFSATAGAADLPGGFLLTVEVEGDGCRLSSAAVIENFSSNRHRDSANDWRVELHNELGEILWRDRFSNPWAVSPTPVAGHRFQFSLRIPHLLDSTEAVYFDHSGQIVLTVALDRTFFEAAEIERRRFIEHDRANRARLDRWAMRRSGKRSQVPTKVAAEGYENLDADIRRQIDSRVAREIELSRFFGISPREAARSGGNLAAASALNRIPEGQQRRDLDLSRKSLKVDEYTVSGTVRDVETSEVLVGATLYFYQYDFDWIYQGYVGSTQTNAAGGYSITAEAGYVYAVIASPSDALYAQKYAYTMVRGDTVLSASMFPGVRLEGVVANTEDLAIRGVVVRATGSGFSAQMSSSQSGFFQLVVPRNQEITLRAQPDPPYAEPYPVDIRLSSDGRQDITLERGHMISGRVRDPGGAPISGATVIIRHLASSSCATQGWSLVSASDGSYSCAVPRSLRPATYLMSVQSDGYVRYSGGVSVVGDTSFDVTLDPGLRVSGRVVDNSGAAIEEAIVRVYQEEEYLTSATSESDGSYELGLERGIYTFRVTPFAEDAPSTLAPAESVAVAVEDDMELDFTLEPSDAVVTVRLRFPSEGAKDLSQGVIRIEVWKGGEPLFVTFDSSSEVLFDSVEDSYYRQTRLYLESGLYDIVVYPFGCHPVTLSGIMASAKTTVEQTLVEPFRWTGVLRTAEGDPLPDLPVISYDDIAVQYTLHSTDQYGQFSVPLTPNGTLRFYSPEQGVSIRRIERIESDVSDRNQDCYLDSFPEVEDDGGILTQIWGTGNTDDRYNLVIIGDGYTDIAETYTDVNANGMWDAVLYYDLNGNGVWDRYPPLERYSIYGAAQAPQDGTDPTVNNEPFVDLNGDDFPNLDDQATYDYNSLALVRSLFGSDVWSQYRDAFNVYRIRVISEQAGQDILDEDYQVFLERDTALNTYIHDPDRRYILAPDYALVEQYINQYAPFADSRIVLMNQPVQIGRATSYMITRGGLTARSANYYVMSHEMGHNVGLLADEYTEFPETYEGPELLRPNITTFTERDRIPWAALIDEDVELPSLPNTPGVGLFEGAYYQPGGVYRPVQRCTMNGSERFCPVCTREIDYIVAGLGSTVPGTAVPLQPVGSTHSVTPRFEWTGPSGASHFLLELTADDGDESYTFDVYSTYLDPEFRLRPNVDYSWRVMPASGNSWGSWSETANFTPQLPNPRRAGRRVSP